MKRVKQVLTLVFSAILLNKFFEDLFYDLPAVLNSSETTAYKAGVVCAFIILLLALAGFARQAYELFIASEKA